MHPRSRQKVNLVEGSSRTQCVIQTPAERISINGRSRFERILVINLSMLDKNDTDIIDVYRIMIQ